MKTIFFLKNIAVFISVLLDSDKNNMKWIYSASIQSLECSVERALRILFVDIFSSYFGLKLHFIFFFFFWYPKLRQYSQAIGMHLSFLLLHTHNKIPTKLINRQQIKKNEITLNEWMNGKDWTHWSKLDRYYIFSTVKKTENKMIVKWYLNENILF